MKNVLAVLLLVATVAGISLIVGRLNPDPRSPGSSSLPRGWVQVKPAFDTATLAIDGGRVWAGGIGGLHLIDRRTAKTLEVPGKPHFKIIRGLLLDRSGALWVAHDKGVARFANGAWTRFGEADGLPRGEALTLLQKRDGTLLVGTEDGVCRWNEPRFEPVVRAADAGVVGIDGLLEDARGAVWACSAHSSRGGLVRATGGKWENVTAAAGLPHNCVTSMLEDPDGTVWVGTGWARAGGLGRFSGGAWTRVTTSDGLAGERVRSVFRDSRGRHWFGSEYDGIAVTDGAAWRTFTPKDGLSGWEVQRMVEDADGYLWLGTEAGVTRIALDAVSLAAKPPVAAAGGAESVVAYVSVDQPHAEPVLREFTRRTGIRVDAVYDVEASKTTGLVNRLIAEASRPRAGVYWSGEFAQTLLLKERGVLAEYAPGAWQEIPPAFRDARFSWVGAGGRIRVLLLAESVTGPTGLRGLAGGSVAPARTGMAYPLFGTSATHAAALWAHWGPEKTAAFYRTLKESGVRVVDGNSVVRDLVVSGELLAGLTDSDDACEAVARGAKVRLVVPDQDGEGTLLIPGTVALIRGGPDRENARRLADFLTSAEAERMLIASGFVQVSLRPGGPVAPCLAGREIKTLPVDLERVRQSLEPSRAAMTGIFLR